MCWPKSLLLTEVAAARGVRFPIDPEARLVIHPPRTALPFESRRNFSRKEARMKTQSLAWTAACFLFVASTLIADEPVPHAGHAVTAAPIPRPIEACPQPGHEPGRGLSRVEHLRRAADHLEAAGAADIARHVREEADSLLQASIEQINQKREQLARLQRELAELERLTGFEQQIMLKCIVADVDVAKLRELGFSFASMTEHGVVEGPRGGSGPFQSGLNDANIIQSIIDALAANGAAKILAEPVLVTTNGRPATLHSGGEFPVPLPDGADEFKIEFREFGLRLEAVPVVLGDGRVRLDIAPEVATRDFENAVTVRDTLVPGLHVRRINTQVEMEFGQTVTLVMPAPGAVERVRQTSAERDDAQPQTVTIFCVTPERIRPMRTQSAPRSASSNLQPLPTY